MTKNPQKTHMVAFESAGDVYAVPAAELAGVATACPFVSYPGLPDGVVGLIQWSGKILPVLDLFGATAEAVPARMFLFSVTNPRARPEFAEVSIAVPGPIRVFAPAEIGPAPKGAESYVVGVTKDGEGRQALCITLADIAKLVPGSRPGGGKLAA